jgi:hypothetical protein
MADPVLDRLVDEYVARARDDVDAALDRYKSPIEHVLLVALLNAGLVEIRRMSDGENFEFIETMRRYSLSGGTVVGVAPERLHGENQLFRALLIQPDLFLCERRMRLDFAIVARHARIAIEADGHDYHERTMMQAARDRSRDRLMLRCRWRVLRFTGSEIVRQPERCAAEVMAVVEAEEQRDTG